MRETLRSVERFGYQRVRSPQAARATQSPPVPWSLDALRGHEFCLLVTHRRDGRAVPTPVWFAVDGEAIVIRSAASDGKVKRVRANPRVLVCACTSLGEPLGPPMAGTARVLSGDAEARAEAALRARLGWRRRAYQLVRDPLLDATYLAVEPRARTGP